DLTHPWQERYEFQVRVRPILFRYRDRISAILNGHDHVAGAFSFDSMPVLLSGAVKEVLPFVPVNRVEEKIRVKTEWIFRPTPTWLRLSVTDFSEDSVAEYVDAATSRVMCSVRIRTGRWLYLEDDCYRGYRRRR